MKNNFHKPIGLSETHKGMSLSVADLLRKTSPQNLEGLKLNSKLKDMFENGLTEVQEDKLLDFLPLHLSAVRDLTDLEVAHNAARMYVREQFEAWQSQKNAAERRRAEFVRMRQQQQQKADSFESTPVRNNVDKHESRPLVQ